MTYLMTLMMIMMLIYMLMTMMTTATMLGMIDGDVDKDCHNDNDISVQSQRWTPEICAKPKPLQSFPRKPACSYHPPAAQVRTQ